MVDEVEENERINKSEELKHQVEVEVTRKRNECAGVKHELVDLVEKKRA